MINKNLMNPVPIHSSMNLWYSNRPTNRGVDKYPVCPTGRIMPTSLTFSDDSSVSVSDRLITFTVTQGGATQTYSLTGNIMHPEQGYVNNNLGASLTITEVANGYTLTFNVGNTDYYILNTTLVSVRNPDSYRVFTEAQLNTTGVTYAAYNTSGTYQADVRWAQTLLSQSFVTSSSSAVQLYLVGCNAQSTAGTVVNGVTVHVGAVPLKYQDTSRFGWFWIEGYSLSGQSEGDYFIRANIFGADYYSEPFHWGTNSNDWLTVTYRRTVPVVCKGNYITFSAGNSAKYLEMYIPATMMKPPYTFDSEVEELDGFKFVQKQVSYHEHKAVFLCTQYFAEAIRLLWHCNIRTISQNGETVDVDYMEPPEVDWGNDCHLCEVTLQFQSDTIVQTNGETAEQSSIGSGTSFDGSFDESFN